MGRRAAWGSPGAGAVPPRPPRRSLRDVFRATVALPLRIATRDAVPPLNETMETRPCAILGTEITVAVHPTYLNRAEMWRRQHPSFSQLGLRVSGRSCRSQADL